MELNIKGTPEEIQKVLRAIATSKEHLPEDKKDVELRVDGNAVAKIIHDTGLDWTNIDGAVYLNPKLARFLDDEKSIKKPNN
ncbi:hypothetical protein AB0Y04_00195 [Loigolactobacillus coryniformis]|uniref:hypothetical protein n=1 Tax=Loigolactobacillus coryniformis TaxID=1610 RepID=UPI003F1FC31A